MDQHKIDHHIATLKGKLKGLKDTDLTGDDTIQASVALWQKQIPKNLLIGKGDDTFVENCPTCLRPIRITAKNENGVFTKKGFIGHYCPWCGQAVKKEI